MQKSSQVSRITSLILLGCAVILVLLQIFLDIDLTLPTIFLVIGTGLFIAGVAYSPRWTWTAYLFIPACIFLVLGIIFLFNVLTGDWKSWAYAWLLGIAGLGLGASLTGKTAGWCNELKSLALVLIAVGIAGFGLFGAIAGGPFLTVMVPVLLVTAAALVYLVPPRAYLPDGLLNQSRGSSSRQKLEPAAGQASISEPLSVREMEVLRLIDQGLSNAEIASKLTLANSTVKTHINNIYGKLGVQNRIQALNRAQELGLLRES